VEQKERVVQQLLFQLVLQQLSNEKAGLQAITKFFKPVEKRSAGPKKASSSKVPPLAGEEHDVFLRD
jgi:hypothetical protein